MPRVYVRKRDTKYTLTDLHNAVKAVQENRMTYRQAEEAYNVPISVIYHRIKGRKVDINRMGAGVSKVLPDRVEEYIASCLKTRAQMGHPVIKEELKNLVKDYVENNNIVNNFNDNKPGDDWYLSFMRRHPELSLKKPEHIQKLRVDARKPYIVYDFYKMLEGVVKNNNLEDKPMYIYNCDESGFQSDPNKLRAIGHKGKALYRVSGGSGRESTTVLACVSADGIVLPPLIVFKGAAVQARWTSEKSYPGTLYAASKNGWMEEPVFFNWLMKSFIPHITKLREERNEPDQKALLLYDGHASHISVRITEEADKANVVLMKFPSHMTDRIQPLDKCVFGPVKKAWEKKLVEHGVEQMGKGTGRLSRAQFGELLGDVYTIAFKQQNIISGFTTTGLYPVNPSKIAKNLFNNEDFKLYSVLLNNEKNNIGESSELTEEEWQEELFQLDLTRLNTENTGDIIQKQKNLQGPEIHEIHLEETNTDIQQKGQNVELKESIISEKTVIINQTRIDETQITGNAIEAEILYDTDYEMTNVDQIIGQEVDIQPQTVEMINQDQTTHWHEVEMQHLEIETTDQNFLEPTIDQQIDRQSIKKVNINKENKQQITEKSNPTLSSTLLNNILKQISLDTQTDSDLKTKIANAILSAVLNEEKKVDETISPNKEALQKIFGVDSATPTKKKKIVIPRLKQSAFGEILTSQEVKERLKEAENKKKHKKKSQTQKKGKLKDITNVEKTQNKKRKICKENEKPQTKKCMKTSKQKCLKDSDDSSDSEIEMSIHSDSDIAQVVTDESEGEPDFEQQILRAKLNNAVNPHPTPEAPGCSRAADEEFVTPEAPGCSRAADEEFVTPEAPGCSRAADEEFATPEAPGCSRAADEEFATPEAPGCSRAADEEFVVEYNEDDTVLVRYILKKKVEYYVGKIITKKGSMMYTVSFYRKVGKSDSTRFIASKRKEIDTVNSNMIVKRVDLMTLNDNETEFTFLNDEDYVYFD